MIDQTERYTKETNQLTGSVYKGLLGRGRGCALPQGSGGQDKKLESSSTARGRGKLDWGKDFYISTEHWDALQGLKCQSFRNISSK